MTPGNNKQQNALDVVYTVFNSEGKPTGFATRLMTPEIPFYHTEIVEAFLGSVWQTGVIQGRTYDADLFEVEFGVDKGRHWIAVGDIRKKLESL